jgi:sulfate permease, SulP family
VESGMFFANADHIRARIRAIAAESSAQSVVLDAETVPFVDVTAAAMLTALTRDLARQDATLFLARDIGQVRDVLRRAGSDALTHAPYPDIDAAVAAATTTASPRAAEGS